MFIVQLEPPHSGGQGDHQYRTAQPCSALGLNENVRVISTTPLSTVAPKLVENCDVLVLCDSADMEHLPLIKRRRAKGLVTVYEVNDNFLGVQAWNSTARFYQNPAHQALIVQLIRLCDGVQFSMPELKNSFGRLNPHQAVFPNHLWEMPPLESKSDSLMVGWGGSYGHLEDVEWMMPVLKWMMETYPQVRLGIMSSPKIESLFSWVPHERFDFRPAADLGAYYSFLSQLHIGIAPLLPTEFNRCRSDVKYLEYAAHRCAPICSDHAPYQFSVVPHENGLLFEDRDDLKEQLKRVIENSALREEVAKGAFDYVAQTRLEPAASQQRLTFYRELLGEGGADSQEQRYRVIEESVANIESTQPQVGSSYRRVDFDLGQKHLYNALLSQSEPDRALEDLAQAQGASADDYLVQLYTGSFGKEFDPAVAALKKAMALRPNACTPHLSLYTHYEKNGDFASAQDSLREFLELNPDYAPAYEALGRILEKQGIPEASVSHYDEALKINADYRPAVHRLVHGYIEQGLLDKAHEVAISGLESLTTTWMDSFLLGRVHYLRREWGAAAGVFETAFEMVVEGFDGPPYQENSPIFSVLSFWAKAELEGGNRERAQVLLEQIKSYQQS